MNRAEFFVQHVGLQYPVATPGGGGVGGVEGQCSSPSVWIEYYRTIGALARAGCLGVVSYGAVASRAAVDSGDTGEKELLGCSGGSSSLGASGVRRRVERDGSAVQASSGQVDVKDSSCACTPLSRQSDRSSYGGEGKERFVATERLVVNEKRRLRNRRKREAKKAKAFGSSGGSIERGADSKRVPVDTGLKSHARRRSGFFGGCSDDVDQKLRQTRAEMYIASNNLKTEQYLAALKELQMSKETRINEVDFEVKRLVLEDKLEKISEKRGITKASSNTTVSPTISSRSSQFLNGSVSPNSSISVAEEQKLRRDVVNQASELKDLRDELMTLKYGTRKNASARYDEWMSRPMSSLYDNFSAHGRYLGNK